MESNMLSVSKFRFTLLSDRKRVSCLLRTSMICLERESLSASQY